MKLSKVFSRVFAVLGAVLMAGTVIACLVFKDASPKLDSVSQEAQQCSERLMQALAEGDIQTAEGLLYGGTTLGLQETFRTPAAAMAWEAFGDCFSYTFAGECYVKGTEIYRDVTVTALDIPATLAALPELAQTRLDQVNAGEPEEAAENAEFYQADVDAVLEEAVRQALAEPKTKEYSVTLQLIEQEGRWQAAADRALLTAISGGLG